MHPDSSDSVMSGLGALPNKFFRTKKNPDHFHDRDLKKPASTYSPALKREVPSAQVGLTSLFEMVRGGPNRHRHRKPAYPKFGYNVFECCIDNYIEYNRSSESVTL